MKEEYDALLKWSFYYKKIFCLLDQTGNIRHIIDSFQYLRDTASEILKVFSLSMLLQDDNVYDVREDTLYIKLTIELNETPKIMLLFMLTLDPALPNNI